MICTNGINSPDWVMIEELRILERRRWVCRGNLNVLHHNGKITDEEYDSVFSMIGSVDPENLVVAEVLIKELQKK